MTNTPEADKKLVQPRAFLADLLKENQKKIGKDRSAVERHLSAFLGAVMSAFYRLQSQFGKQQFGITLNQWKMSTLTQEQREFFNNMTDHRGRDVHHEDIQLSVKTSATAAYFVPGIDFASGPLLATLANPVDAEEPAYASVFVSFEKYRLEKDDIQVTCEKYLNMMEKLVEWFKQTAITTLPKRAIW